MFQMASGGGPPGLDGATAHSGFGHVGGTGRRYTQLARAFTRPGEVRDNVENDQFSVEKNVKELASLLVDAIQATGATFEEELLGCLTW